MKTVEQSDARAAASFAPARQAQRMRNNGKGSTADFSLATLAFESENAIGKALRGRQRRWLSWRTTRRTWALRSSGALRLCDPSSSVATLVAEAPTALKRSSLKRKRIAVSVLAWLRRGGRPKHGRNRFKGGVSVETPDGLLRQLVVESKEYILDDPADNDLDDATAHNFHEKHEGCRALGKGAGEQSGEGEDKKRRHHFRD